MWTFKIKKVRTEVLTMKTFGNTEEKIERLEVVNIKIASLCGKYQRVIVAYSVPMICSPITNQTINLALDKYSQLRKMNLADSRFGSPDKVIDILIGANYYWSFTEGNTVRIDRDLVDLDVNSINLTSAHILKVSCEAQTPENSDIHNFERFWEMEIIGINRKFGELNANQFLK